MKANKIFFIEDEEYYSSIEALVDRYLNSNQAIKCIGVFDVGFFGIINSRSYVDGPVEHLGSAISKYQWSIAFFSYTTVSHLNQMRNLLREKGYDGSNLNIDPFASLPTLMLGEFQGVKYPRMEPEGMQNYGFGLQIGEPPTILEEWEVDSSRINYVGTGAILRLLPPEPSRFGIQPLVEEHISNLELPYIAPTTAYRMPQLLGEFRDKTKGAFIFFCDRHSDSPNRYLAWSQDPNADSSLLLNSDVVVDFRAGNLAVLGVDRPPIKSSI